MSGPHLDARVTPLVDGRLAPDAAARASEHLQVCTDCADAVESERLVRARLQTMGTPQMSDDLVTRLLDIGGPSGPLPPRDRPMAVPARPVVGVAPPSRTDPAHAGGGRGPAGRAVRRRVRRRPVAAALAGTFSLLGAGIVGVLVLGGLPGGSAPAPVAELRTTPSAAPSSEAVSKRAPMPGATVASVPDDAPSPSPTQTSTTSAAPTTSGSSTR